MQRVSYELLAGDDVVQIAQSLLGKELIHRLPNGEQLSGYITETEAYMGPNDKASHAWNNRRTTRTEPMFADAGTCYVYVCYGIHHLINVVTNTENNPHAVLIRAIFPHKGLKTQLQNRKKSQFLAKDFIGPGKVSVALSVTTHQNWVNLLSEASPLQLFNGIDIPESTIDSGTRIGIDYAEEWALKPWRFFVKPRLLNTLFHNRID